MQFGTSHRVTLYGRFTSLPKARLERLLTETGARPLRDLTRQSTHMVVGEAALALGERLFDRLAIARARGVPVLAERRFLAMLRGVHTSAMPTVPVDRVAHMSDTLLDLLHAFGLVTHAEGMVAFEDASMLKTAARLENEEQEWPDIVAALMARRDSPKGRHDVVIGADGRAVLRWDDTVTDMDGQQFLPLNEPSPVDDLFEQALDAEAVGDLESAARLFETCARADRKDALASFNLGNVRRELGDLGGALIAYQQATARDPRLAEAQYNLAVVFEKMNDTRSAASALRSALAVEPRYADALFNLAHLELDAKNFLEAKVLFEKFLATGVSGTLVGSAERALRLISMEREQQRNSRPG